MLRDIEGLRRFCDELSSDEPSPGGGTASAASGAMAASLLAMVCRLTLKNKRHEENWTELAMLTDSLMTLRDELVALAQEDADAYDGLVEAIRRRKSEDSEEARGAMNAALEEAIETPRKTAGACARILEISARVAEIGTRRAYSDVIVGIHMAAAGIQGAHANVRINLDDSDDEVFSEEVRKDMKDQAERASRAEKEALSKLSPTPPPPQSGE